MDNKEHEGKSTEGKQLDFSIIESSFLRIRNGLEKKLKEPTQKKEPKLKKIKGYRNRFDMIHDLSAYLADRDIKKGKSTNYEKSYLKHHDTFEKMHDKKIFRIYCDYFGE